VFVKNKFSDLIINI